VSNQAFNICPNKLGIGDIYTLTWGGVLRF
jgi:hypothetical protein